MSRIAISSALTAAAPRPQFVLVDRRRRRSPPQRRDRPRIISQIGIDGLRDVLADGLAARIRPGRDRRQRHRARFFRSARLWRGQRGAAALLDALPEPLLGHRRYRCGNDMVCAWAGSLGGEDGINIVAGTGSIGYGERARQDRARRRLGRGLRR